MQYKGHHQLKYVRPEKVKEAFYWLKRNNLLYRNSKENVNWEKDCCDEDQETWNELTGVNDEIHLI